jgi:hypothetical protein
MNGESRGHVLKVAKRLISDTHFCLRGFVSWNESRSSTRKPTGEYAMNGKLLTIAVLSGLLVSLPAQAASKKTKNAAAVGAGVGLVTGGVSGAAKGAVVGGGAGAYANADKGDKAKKDAKKAAAVGAGVGLLTDGVSGAAKGAVYGGAGGALYGEHKDKKKKKKEPVPQQPNSG